MSIQQKQTYLRNQVMEEGFDPNTFQQYWIQLQVEFDSITLQQLERIVRIFKQKYKKQQSSPTEQQFSDYVSAESQHTQFDWGFLQIKTNKNTNEDIFQDKKIEQPIGKIHQLNNINQQKSNKNTSNKQNNDIDLLDLSQKKINKSEQKQKSQQKSNSNNNNQHKILPDNSISIKDVYQQSTTQIFKCLKLQTNILDHHNNVEIHIQQFIVQQQKTEDQVKKQKGLISKLWQGAKTTIGLNQLPMIIQTIGRNNTKNIGVSWKVIRKRNDFQWLHKMLMKFYPGTIVPPLPSIPRSQQKVYGYMKKLQSFLSDTYKCRQLRNSKYFENFLSFSNRQDFQNLIKTSQGICQPGTLSHVLNMKGQIDLYYGDTVNEYSQNLNKYIVSQSSHLKAVKSITSQIVNHYENLCINFHQLANVFNQMSQQAQSFNIAKEDSKQQNNFITLAQTYAQISSLMSKHSQFCLQQKQSVDTFMYSHFSYEKDRMQNIQNLINKRSIFNQALKKLQLQKQKQENKSSRFGLSKITSLFGNKNQSLDIPSNNIDTLKQQVGFYNSQVLKQSERCIDVIIQSYVNHFSNYGHSRVDNVDSMQQVWSRVMVQFSKIKM